MTRNKYAQLAVLPFFALLAVGSSSPKKGENGAKPGDTATGTTTTTGGGTPKIVSRCMQKQGDQCTENYARGILGEEFEKKNCEALEGIYVSGPTPCPSKDTLIGVCASPQFQTSPDDKPSLRDKMYYYDEGVNKDLAGSVFKDACTHGISGVPVSTWTDGPALTKAVAKPTTKAAAAAAKPAAAPAKKK